MNSVIARLCSVALSVVMLCCGSSCIRKGNWYVDGDPVHVVYPGGFESAYSGAFHGEVSSLSLPRQALQGVDSSDFLDSSDSIDQKIFLISETEPETSSFAFCIAAVSCRGRIYVAADRPSAVSLLDNIVSGDAPADVVSVPFADGVKVYHVTLGADGKVLKASERAR